MKRVVGATSADDRNRAVVEYPSSNPLVDFDALNLVEDDFHGRPANEADFHDDPLVGYCKLGGLVTDEGADEPHQSGCQEDDADGRDIAIKREDGETQEHDQGGGDEDDAAEVTAKYDILVAKQIAVDVAHIPPVLTR